MSELAETLLRKLFLYGAECKYFRLYWPYGFCPNYSTLFNSAIVEHQRVFHRQYINKWVWLCSNEMLCIKTVGVWIWPVGCCLLFPSLEHCLLFTHEETKTQRDFKKFVAVTDQLEVGYNISKSCIRFIYLFIFWQVVFSEPKTVPMLPQRPQERREKLLLCFDISLPNVRV